LYESEANAQSLAFTITQSRAPPGHVLQYWTGTARERRKQTAFRSIKPAIDGPPMSVESSSGSGHCLGDREATNVPSAMATSGTLKNTLFLGETPN
jgi:hypothetical protein